MTKDSKELDDIGRAIQKWANKHDDKVAFVGAFIAFKDLGKKDLDIKEDRLIAYGNKIGLRTILKCVDEDVENEKEDFVDWFG